MRGGKHIQVKKRQRQRQEVLLFDFKCHMGPPPWPLKCLKWKSWIFVITFRFVLFCFLLLFCFLFFVLFCFFLFCFVLLFWFCFVLFCFVFVLFCFFFLVVRIFFKRKACLYITLQEKLNYWLKFLKCGLSSIQKRKFKIVIVGTHFDQIRDQRIGKGPSNLIFYIKVYTCKEMFLNSIFRLWSNSLKLNNEHPL